MKRELLLELCWNACAEQSEIDDREEGEPWFCVTLTVPQGLNRLRKNSISEKVRKMDRVKMPLERSARIG
jgi:hypothetical protein